MQSHYLLTLQMKRYFLQIQTTSDWAQIWCGGWNCVLIEVYQISAKSETNFFLRFGLVCFGHKSGLAHPPYIRQELFPDPDVCTRKKL